VKNTRIRAAAATGLLEAVAEAGVEPLRVLAAADLVAADLADPDQLIDMSRIAALFEAAAAETRNELFGLQMSLASTLEVVGTLAYLLLNAPTVETALRNLERYSSLHMPGAPISMECGASDVHLVLEMNDSLLGQCRQLVEACVGFTLILLRTLTRQEFVPHRILFVHPRPAHADEHSRLFGAPVGFGQPRNELLFDVRWLAYPIASADRTLLPIVEKHVQEVLEARANEDALITSVRELAAQAVCDGHPNIAGIARHVGMSARTLQRRLAESGNSFKDLVDDVRSDLAREYLSRSSADVTEISFLLGYSELSAFDRAFRRWTGMAPREYRNGTA
jgi:AraC-like DNA-binding protein